MEGLAADKAGGFALGQAITVQELAGLVDLVRPGPVVGENAYHTCLHRCGRVMARGAALAT
jgi:hypothetical protein